MSQLEGAGTPENLKFSLKVYWQPGCSSCLKTKEFLLDNGVPFESINVLEDKNLSLVKWNFEYRKSKKKISFNGTSELLIKKNLIYKHIDYWDSGKNFYSNLPLVGSIFRKIHY